MIGPDEAIVMAGVPASSRSRTWSSFSTAVDFRRVDPKAASRADLSQRAKNISVST